MKKKDPDQLLLEGIIRSDVPSYEAVYRTYGPRVLSFIKGLLKDAAKAEDVTQNVFLKLWASRADLDASKSLRNWLFVLAKNEVVNIFRSKNHTAMTYRDNIPENAAETQTVESAVEYTETSRALERAVEAMPPVRRQVFRMSRYENRSIQEIAQILNLSPRTVEKHISLALKDLRRNFN